MRIPELLRQPYPSTESPGQELKQAVIIGLFVGLFLLLFQPFGLSTWRTPDKSLKILGFGFIAFGITAFNFIVWIKLFPLQFSDERWTVGRQILFITANVLLIAVGNRLYLDWLLRLEGHSMNISWVGMILVTFLIGLFPTTGAVLFNYIRQLKKYRQSAAGFSVLPSAPVNQGISVGQADSAPMPSVVAPISLTAENEKDRLELPTVDLLYIESSDNYCTVVYYKDNQILKPLLRSSLSRLEGQINQPRIVRCHRSYVVNLDQVERVTGNAQGYRLHLAGGLLQVPVARQYNDTLVAELKTL